MFPQIPSQSLRDIFSQIQRQNQEKHQVRQDEIQLQFLVDEMELIDRNLVRYRLNQQSMYMTAEVSPNIESLLAQIAQTREVHFDPVYAFNQWFSSARNVDLRLLDRALKANRIQFELAQLPELMAYLTQDRIQSTFHLIHWNQGLKPWVTGQRQPRGQVAAPQGFNAPPPQQWQQQPQGWNNQQPPPQQWQQQPQGWNNQQPPPQQWQQQPQGWNNQQPPAQNPHWQAATNQNLQGFQIQNQLFDPIVNKFNIDLGLIMDAVHKRHTGVYKWFQINSQTGVTITNDEFYRAIVALNVQGVSTVNQIYESLQLQGPQHPVKIPDINTLFKVYRQKNLPKINADQVCQQILRAFNADDAYIQMGLQKEAKAYPNNVYLLELDSFIKFFSQWENHKSFYSLDDVTILGETHCEQHSDNVSIGTFSRQLANVRQASNIMPDPKEVGIQNQRVSNPDSMGALNTLQPGFSGDCTKAALQAGLRAPNFFRPHSDEFQISTIIKGCFIKKKFVQEHFSDQVGGRNIMVTDFEMALNNLGVPWNSIESQKIFNLIDQSMNGVQRGQITATDVDSYVHFSKRHNVQQLHTALMAQVEQRISERRLPLESEFHLRAKPGQSICTLQDFKEVLRNLALALDERDMNFIAMPYTASNQFQFKKFCDDIIQLQRVNVQLQSTYGAQDDAGKIAEAHNKVLYSIGFQEIDKYWSQFGTKPLTQLEFVAAMERLNLVPPFAREQMSQLYLAMDGSSQQLVHISKIVAFFQLKCQKHASTLLTELLRKWQGQNVEQYFSHNPDFQRTGTMRMNDFEIILGDRLKYSRIDAQFISKFFAVGGDVDVRKFIGECNTTVAPGEEANEVINQIATALIQYKRDLNYELSKYRIGNSMSISVQDFEKVYSSILQLTEADRQRLERAYLSPEGLGRIDYIRFQEDVKNCQPDFNTVALTRQQELTYSEAKRLLGTGTKRQEFVTKLVQYDFQNSGYIARSQIIDALNSVGVTREFITQKLDILFSVVNTNQQGEFQWKQFVKHMFGQEATSLVNHANQTQTTAGQPVGHTNYSTINSASVQRPVGSGGQALLSPQTAVNNYMGSLGRKIGTRAEEYASLLMRSRKSMNQGEPLVTEMDAMNCVAQLGVMFEVDERNAFQNYFIQNQDVQRQINGHTLMRAMGLQPPAKQKNTMSQKKILTENELQQAHQFIMLLRREALQVTKQRPEQIIAKYRTSQAELTMTPQNFQKALKQEFSSSESIGPKLKSQTTMVNLVHYLVREEPFKVSYGKLLEAFALQENSAPLRQEGIEDLLKYSTQLQTQMQQTKVPLSVIELHAFMKKNGLHLQSLLQQPNTSNLHLDMSVNEFEQHLSSHGYSAKEMDELVKAIQNNETGTTKVSIALLQKSLRTLMPPSQSNPKAAQQKYGKMTAQVRSKIQQISDYMQKQNITLKELHSQLDINRDGGVDKAEFVEGVTRIIMLPSLTRQDLGTIFDAIDLNNDKSLSLNEFGYYLEGAKLKKEQKKANIDPATLKDLTHEINALFMQLSQGKQYVNAVDIFKIMQSLQQNTTTMDKAQEMIRAVDKNNDGNIDSQEFCELLMPILTDELVAEDDQLEDMRAKFREADVDYSGFLSVDEFYACLLSMGADVSRQEVVSMFLEFDANQDMQIDIDEFIKFFSVGEQIEFQDEQNAITYMKIKKARKLKPLDFLKVFNSMPQTFTPSFFTERWQKAKRNLPSSAFKAQIDPKTMLYKDMAPVQTEHLTSEQMQKENRPRVRPIPTQIGTQITIESAQGVPLPKETSEFSRDNIVKRVVRVGLFDVVKKELIHNSCYVVAEWKQQNEDIWNFLPPSKSESLNPILFRSTQKDDLNRQDIEFIFELVVYVYQNDKTTEWTAGWATTPLSTCEKDQSKIRLEIQGGNPRNNIAIQKDDIQAKRTGINYLQKVFTASSTKSTLFVSFKPSQYLEAETKYHLELLPSTCFIQKKLLNFVSGYRNYAAEQLLPSLATDSHKKPVGNIVMSNFPKVLDCPDILEVLCQLWWEDHMQTMNISQRKSVELAMKKMEGVMNRIYPVIYSDEFEYSAAEATQSCCGRTGKLQQRKTLLISAIRHNTGKVKNSQSLEMLTTFRPFNVREIEFDVWDLAEGRA